MRTYERDGMYAGFQVRSCRTGWLVENWSREQGAMGYGRWIVAYSDRFPRDADLEASAGLVAPTSVGEMIETVARFAEQFPAERVRCLRRPHRVG